MPTDSLRGRSLLAAQLSCGEMPQMHAAHCIFLRETDTSYAPPQSIAANSVKARRMRPAFALDAHAWMVNWPSFGSA